MSRQSILVCALGALLIVSFQSSVARGDTLAHWTFNSPGPGVDDDPTTGTLSPEIGAGTITRVGGVSDSGFAQGSNNDTSPTVGNNNNSSFETQNYPPFDTANKTAGLQIAVNTTGFQDIAISFEHSHAPGASASFRIQYSTDGVNFTDGDGYTASGANTFNPPRADDFSDIAGLDNNPNATFRIVAEFQGQAYAGVGGTYMNNARNRFDLITVTGTPIPEPAAVAATSLLVALGLGLRRRR